MQHIRAVLFLSTAVLATACNRELSKADDALKNDLALASQAQPYNAQQFTSPVEAGAVYNPYTGQNQPARRYSTPAVQSVSTRRAPMRRTSSRSAGSSRVVYAPAPEPIRHTQRDAAIGAATGAVIGATVSRDKLKGGLIGAAAGAILGGIIGHTVDVEKP